MTMTTDPKLDALLALIPDPDDYWYIEDRAHDNERGQYIRFVIDRRPVEKAAGRRLYVNEEAGRWAIEVFAAIRALVPHDPHPNCVEYVLEDGRRFAWSESNVQYEEVPEDGASFTLLRQRLIDSEEKVVEMEATFDLRWKADMRAIKRWQAAHPGNDLVWPDHADMVVWLLEQMP